MILSRPKEKIRGFNNFFIWLAVRWTDMFLWVISTISLARLVGRARIILFSFCL